MTKSFSTASRLLFIPAALFALVLTAAATAQTPPPVTLPTLTEADITNFIEIFPVAVKDPASLIQTLNTKGVDPLRYQGVATKLTANLGALSSPEVIETLKPQFGESVVLNDDEKVLFDKYKDQLIVLLTPPAAK
ncbi:MAG: hypothetical protein LBR53_12455 [Deltaproteobacteria bacterium]|jgi:hypothetical protein|nr:hypothetical protein [Deltaproteobacteria bacterium]